MSRLGKLANGIILTALVAGLVLVVAGALPALVSPISQDNEETTYSEFDPDTIVSEPLAASGGINPNADLADTNGEVVIDAAASNRFERADIQPMIAAINRVGYEATIDSSRDYEDKLANADALIIIDPGSEYSEGNLDEIEEFMNDGGRVLVLGEPNRVNLRVSLFGATIQTQESSLTTFENRFDLQFNTEYVYDQDNNDGNFRRPIVSPHDDAEISPSNTIDNANNVVMYTPTEVKSTSIAEPVLVTSSSAKQSGQDGESTRTVAIRDGNLLAVGDASFIGAERHNVGDNDVFLTAVVEFLVSEGQSSESDSESEGDNGGSTSGNETASSLRSPGVDSRHPVAVS